MRRPTPLFVALCGCLWACASTAAAPAATPAIEETDSPTAEEEPAEVEQTESADTNTATPDSGAEPSEAQAKAARINARYAQQTDPEKWVKQFEREGREVHDRRDAIVSQLAIPPGSVVADLGAGTGLFTFPFSLAVGETGRVIAVDVQDYFLEHIERRAKEASVTNVEVRKATQGSSGLDPQSVDVAFLCDVYHHLEQPAAYLATVRAALREGGRLVVVDYDRTKKGAKKWLVDHIRADPATFQAEIEAAGFVRTQAPAMLEDNFFFVFEAAPQP